MNKKKSDFFQGIVFFIIGIFFIVYGSLLFHKGYVTKKYPKQVVSFDQEEKIYIHLDKYCPFATIGARINKGNETSNLTIFSTHPPYTWPCPFSESELRLEMLALKGKGSDLVKIDKEKQVGYAFWLRHYQNLPPLICLLILVMFCLHFIINYSKRASPHGERIKDTEMQQVE